MAASTLKNRFASLGVQQKLVLSAAGFCLIFGLIALSSLWIYIDRLGQQQSDKLGHTLSAQLAEQSRQAMLYKDKISLQVLVNSLLSSNQEVASAAIFDKDDKLLVQSQRGRDSDSGRSYDPDMDQSDVYQYQIKLEQSTAGHVQLVISSSAIKGHLRPLFWSALALWLIGSSLLSFGLAVAGGNLAQRLVRIIGRLPAGQLTEQPNEIDQLEVSLKPLLVKALTVDALKRPGHLTRHPESDHQYSRSLTLSIHCQNLQRLKDQLTRQNYRAVLRNFDAVSNCAIKLFDGARLTGSQDCLHVNFSCDGDQDNALLRAVSCYTGITDILGGMKPKSGAGLNLCAALGLTGIYTSDCQFEQDQQHQAELKKLSGATALAKPWQLVIQADLLIDDPENSAGTGTSAEQMSPSQPQYKTLINYEVIPTTEAVTLGPDREGACDKGQARQAEPAITDTKAESEIATGSKMDINNLRLFKSIGAEFEEVLAGQLAYLHSQLPEQAAHLNEAAFE